jgi:NTP pyrophosphatase (non-canonical NTP hydrolase)
VNEPCITLAEYQSLAMRTHHNDPRLSLGCLPIYECLGLAGETGELVDKIKKSWRNQTPLDREAAARELGDVLWYVTAIAVELGYTLEEVAVMNIAKLADRQARGVIKSEGDNR